MTKAQFFLSGSGSNRHWLLVIGHSAFLVLCLVASSSALAATGTLRTKEGQNLQGDIGIESGGFKVTDAARTVQHVELARVVWVQIEKEKRRDDPVVQAGLKGNGLLGAYFTNADLAGPAQYRLDENIDFNWGDSWPLAGIPADRFSVRWTGQLQVPTNGDYTFIANSDDGVRLWLNGDSLFDHWRIRPSGELRARRTLAAGRKYDFKLEYFEDEYSAAIRLFWEIPGKGRSLIPKECFSTSSRWATNAPATGLAGAGLSVNRPGVLLRDGNFLAGNVRGVDNEQIQMDDRKEFSPLLSSVARIHFFWELNPAGLARLQGGRPGVLLNNGDFVEGEIKAVSGKQVRVSSVLYGLRTFEANNKVAAIVLRDPVPGRRRYEIKLGNGSLLRTDVLECEKSGLVIREGLLRGLKINPWELQGLRVEDGSKSR